MKPDHLCRVGKGARAESFRLASLTARAVPTRSVANSAHGAQSAVAVGMLIAEHPPHRSGRAAFPHTAPTSDV